MLTLSVPWVAIRLDRVVDLTTEDLLSTVMEETGGQGVDFILETVPFTEPLVAASGNAFCLVSRLLGPC